MLVSYMAIPGILNNMPVTLDSIENAVCTYFNITPEQLRHKTRKIETLEPRQLAMYFASKLTKYPLSAIGQFFGGFNHATVLHARNKIDGYVHVDKRYKEYVNNIKKTIKQ